MTININLLPWREALKERHKKEFLSLMACCVFFAVFIGFCVHMTIARQINFQNEDNNYLRREIDILDKQITEIQQLQSEKEQLLARMEIIQQLQTNRPLVVRLFDVIVKTVPDGLYLANLTRTHAQVLMDGRAESNTRVSKFMRNIESSASLKSPLLTLIQVDDKSAEQKQNDKMIDFNLQAMETTDAASNLNKLLKQDKLGADGKPKEKQPNRTPIRRANDED